MYIKCKTKKLTIGNQKYGKLGNGSSVNVTINQWLLSNTMSNQMTHVRKVNNNYADLPGKAEECHFET